MSPLYPPAWDEIEAPSIVAEPPGPKSREILERVERTAYAGLASDILPLAVADKAGWTVTDADGNVFLDCISSSASVPLGAGRREILEPALAAVERFGNEDSSLPGDRADRRVGRAASGRGAEEPHPLRHRPQRDRGGRDRHQDDAPRDRAARDHRLSRLVPRRVDHDGRAGRGGRARSRAACAPWSRASHTSRIRTRTARPSRTRAPAAAATPPSTSSATTSSSTPSTPRTSRASSSSPSSARAAAWLPRTRSGPR